MSESLTTTSLTQAPLKSLVEAILFASGSPVLIEQLAKTVERASKEEIRQTLKQLTEEYEDSARGLKILEIAGGYQMVTKRELAPYVKRFLQKVPERLSRQCLETLAITAYRQPITRLEIEQIRGVSAESPLQTLLEKGMLKIAGRKEVLGRPFLYGTTPLFLERFGLGSLEDLPQLEEITKMNNNENLSTAQTN